MLRDTAFDARTRDAVLCATCPDDFAAAFYERLDAGRLSPLTMALVALESPASHEWPDLRGALVDHLAKHPHVAVQVFEVATTALDGWASTRSTVVMSGEPHAPTFAASCAIDMPGRGDVIGEASGRTAKLASQRAAVALLARLSDATPPVFDEPVVARVAEHVKQAAAIGGERDPISVLYEHAAARHVKAPRFRQMASGMPVVFACVCAYDGREASGTGATKQAAKRAASAAMVAALATKAEAAVDCC